MRCAKSISVSKSILYYWIWCCIVFCSSERGFFCIVLCVFAKINERYQSGYAIMLSRCFLNSVLIFCLLCCGKISTFANNELTLTINIIKNKLFIISFFTNKIRATNENHHNKDSFNRQNHFVKSCCSYRK